jgi:hypothetical protein
VGELGLNRNVMEAFEESFKDILKLSPGERLLWVSRASKVNLDPILKEVPRDTTDWFLWKGASVQLWLAMKDGIMDGFLIVSNKRLMFFRAEMKRTKALIWKSINLDLILDVNINDITNIKSKENFMEIYYWNGGEMDILILVNYMKVDPEHPGYINISKLMDINKVTEDLQGIVSIGKE